MNTQSEILEQPAEQPVVAFAPPPIPRVAPPRAGPVIAQRTGCPTCGAVAQDASGATGAPSYVYAIGNVEARFPNLAAEKEFAQATGRADTAGKTDQQTFNTVLSQRQNRYLARPVVLGANRSGTGHLSADPARSGRHRPPDRSHPAGSEPGRPRRRHRRAQSHRSP